MKNMMIMFLFSLSFIPISHATEPTDILGFVTQVYCGEVSSQDTGNICVLYVRDQQDKLWGLVEEDRDKDEGMSVLTPLLHRWVLVKDTSLPRVPEKRMKQALRDFRRASYRIWDGLVSPDHLSVEDIDQPTNSSLQLMLAIGKYLEKDIGGLVYVSKIHEYPSGIEFRKEDIILQSLFEGNRGQPDDVASVRPLGTDSKSLTRAVHNVIGGDLWNSLLPEVNWLLSTLKVLLATENEDEKDNPNLLFFEGTIADKSNRVTSILAAYENSTNEFVVIRQATMQ